MSTVKSLDIKMAILTWRFSCVSVEQIFTGSVMGYYKIKTNWNCLSSLEKMDYIWRAVPHMQFLASLKYNIQT